ncbi:MAG TPA: M23 family metallopeptidase [Cytophagaceae bacterium]|jgi:murein DD-endopeptidase MepM/ murein hydrolase activator NlpD|nr:M23 family metallopeptidase [Cytophagaceae bacterium]
MQRKTLTERLTNKYQLIVRNEENFADRWTLSFNFAKLLVILTILVLLFYALVTGINFLGAYLLGSSGSEETRELAILAAKTDSMEYELGIKDLYIRSFKTMLDGGQPRTKDTLNPKPEKNTEEKVSAEEEEFRKKFEKETTDPSYRSKDGFEVLYFFTPVSGKLTDVKQGAKITGLMIEADTKKPVRSLDDGIVLINSRNADSTSRLVLQYKTGLVTIYDRLKSPSVKQGDWVEKGGIIASAGAQKVLFTMSYNGKLLNPRQYVSWDK